jgi:WD40 repeat protein
MPVKLFFCYAHEDEPLLNKLKSQLSPLRRQGLIEMWHDRDISAGTKWEEEIDTHLNEANIVLLLVSPDFMDSDYCYGVELQRALERDRRGEARVIPVILRPVYWQGVLGTLQALPTDAKPVMSSLWHYEDEALFNVTEGIRKVVEEISSSPPALVSPIYSLNQQSQQSAKAKHLLIKDYSWLCTFTLTEHTDSVESVAISPDGKTLASGSYDHTIKLWNLKSGDLLYTLEGHASFVESVAISPDGKTLASGSWDHTIKVWNLKSGLWNQKTGNVLYTLEEGKMGVSSVAISPDGKTLASANTNGDNTTKLWNLKSGEHLRTFEEPETGIVTSIAISPDGKILASGYSITIKLWNLQSGDFLRTLKGHEKGVSSIAISPDGKTLASGSYDHTIKLWNLNSAVLLYTLEGHIDSVSSVAISPDGKTLASGSWDHTIKL